MEITTTVEKTILKNLIYNNEYMRKVLPYVKAEYFEDISERTIFQELKSIVEKYSAVPKAKEIYLSIEKRKDLTEDQFKRCGTILAEIVNSKKEENNTDWLKDVTEEWCQDRALYLALVDSIAIADKQKKGVSKSAIPHILSEALGVSFNSSVGHDYLDDAEARFEYYHQKETKHMFSLDIFNKITRGGLPNKTLSVVMAPTGGGKSIFLAHYAAEALRRGENVLYITLELSEKEVGRRIDANLLNIPINDLEEIPKDLFLSKVAKIRTVTDKHLKIVEYPTGSAHVGHFRALLDELKLKKQFVPTIIIVDYINICASARVVVTDSNSYGLIKKIAEELRGLAIEKDVPIFSATQLNRSGMENSDPELTNTADSIGLPYTVDFLFVLIRSEELDKLGHVIVKQLKNRFNDENYYKRFVIGLDKSKMRFFDVTETIQGEIAGGTSSSQKQQKSQQRPVQQHKDNTPMKPTKKDFLFIVE